MSRDPHAHWIVAWQDRHGARHYEMAGDGGRLALPEGAEILGSQRFPAQDIAAIETRGRLLKDVLVERYLGRPVVLQAAE